MSKEEENTKQFLTWYEKYADDLFRYCFFKSSDREASLEIVQDVFGRMWQNIQKGREFENARAFLYASARNSVIDLYRKKKTISLDALEEETGFEAQIDYTQGDLNKMEAERILGRADELEGSYKEVVMLRFVNDLSVQEIAKLLGEKENNISVRIHRALEKLKKLYIPKK